MSIEAPVSEGDEVRSLSQEELGQGDAHAHAAEDDEPDMKVKIIQARMNIF